MTPMLAWFTESSAQSFCWALLHSLWQGVIWCLLLALCLSLVPRNKPGLRYSASLLCLAGVALSVLATWSILRLPPSLVTPLVTFAQPRSHETDTTTAARHATPSPETIAVTPAERNEVDSQHGFIGGSADLRTQDWLNELVDRTCPILLWGWAIGVTLNLFRCMCHRAAASEWKHGEPIRDPAVLELLCLLKSRLKIRRPVRLIASLRASGPCVVGTLAPVILVPLSLASGMSPDQWKAVLTHELAHLRRWDELVNFGQQVFESLLFFNPAVWWISHQIRVEREACCDVWGARITASPFNYAQVLVEIAEKLTPPRGAPALAFADERAGSLMDRVRRLVAGHGSTRTQLTRPVTLLLIVVAIAVVVLLQRGTDLAIFSAATLLSDRERVTELAKVAEEVNPQIVSSTEKLVISGKVSTSDGGPLPKSIWINSQTQNGNSGTGITQGEIKGEETDEFRVEVPPGVTWLQFVGDGYAMATVGPFVSGRSAEVSEVQVVFKRGLPLTLAFADEAGQPITGANVTASTWAGGSGFGLSKIPDTDSTGQTVIRNIDPERRHSFSVTAPGFQKLDVPAALLTYEAPLQFQLTRAQVASGKVLGPDGMPLAGATLRKLRTRRFQHTDHSGMGRPPMATTNEHGEFVLDQLLDGSVYDLLVQHPNYASAVLKNIQPGSRDRVIQLQDGVTVSGVIRGTPQQFEALQKIYRGYRVFPADEGAFDAGQLSFNIPLQVTPNDGEARFQLDHLPLGRFEMTLGEQKVERELAGPLTDLVIDLQSTSLPQKRDVELVFRKGADVVIPEGRLQLLTSQTLAGNQKQQDFTTATFSEGRMVTQLAVPGEFRIQTNQLIGFTLADEEFVAQVPVGEGTFVVDIPVQPAGGVRGVVLNTDGTPATGVQVYLSTVISTGTLLNSGEKRNSLNAQVNDSGEYFFSPVAFGARCELRAGRDKFFALGPQFTMSKQRPLPEFKLQFNSSVSAGVRVLDSQGKPLQGIPVIIRCEHPRVTTTWSPPESTDAQGEVVIPQVDPAMVSSYQAIIVPTKSYRNAVVQFEGDRTVEVHLQPGLFLAGTLLHQNGRPLSGRRVTASAGRYFGMDQNRYAAEAMTDEEGKFRFSNLPAEEVRIDLEYGSWNSAGQKFAPTPENQLKPITIQSSF